MDIASSSYQNNWVVRTVRPFSPEEPKETRGEPKEFKKVPHFTFQNQFICCRTAEPRVSSYQLLTYSNERSTFQTNYQDSLGDAQLQHQQEIPWWHHKAVIRAPEVGSAGLTGLQVFRFIYMFSTVACLVYVSRNIGVALHKVVWHYVTQLKSICIFVITSHRMHTIALLFHYLTTEGMQ